MRAEEDFAAARPMQFHVVSCFRQRIVRDGAEVVGLAIRAGKHAENARHFFCRCGVDPDNAGVCMRGPHDGRVSLARQTKVVAELAAPCEQPRILGARQRLADKAEFGGLFGHR